MKCARIGDHMYELAFDTAPHAAFLDVLCRHLPGGYATNNNVRFIARQAAFAHTDIHARAALSQLSHQLNALSRVKLYWYGFADTDVLVADGVCVMANPARVCRLGANGRITLTAPFVHTPEFAPELTTVARLPAHVHHTAAFWSIGVFLRNVHATAEHTKMDGCIRNATRAEPLHRILVYI